MALQTKKLSLIDMDPISNETKMQQSEDGSQLTEFGDSIDAMTFEQILEMDDDEDDRDFSRSIVFGFFDQAETTFQKMEESL